MRSCRAPECTPLRMALVVIVIEAVGSCAGHDGIATLASSGAARLQS